MNIGPSKHTGNPLVLVSALDIELWLCINAEKIVTWTYEAK